MRLFHSYSQKPLSSPPSFSPFLSSIHFFSGTSQYLLLEKVQYNNQSLLYFTELFQSETIHPQNRSKSSKRKCGPCLKQFHYHCCYSYVAVQNCCSKTFISIRGMVQLSLYVTKHFDRYSQELTINHFDIYTHTHILCSMAY